METKCPVDAKCAAEISALLTPPSPLQLQEYFEEIISERKCHGIEVKQDGNLSKGVYGTMEFKEGDLIMKDKILVGIQHVPNKLDCLVCGNCFQFIESVEYQIGRKLYLQSLGVPSCNGCDEGMGFFTFWKIDFIFKSCAETDWESSHSLLCTGERSESVSIEALSKFIQHATETNDIFLLAAKTISFIILRYRKLKAAYAWKPISMGYKRRWWDCISFPDDVDRSDDTAFRMQIQIFSLEIYGNIIGMFELNNLDLVVASPVEDYFLYIDDLPDPEKEKAEKIARQLLDALGDGYSICCQGTAFYPLQSCINHSCCPNAHAFKRDEDRDGQAAIVTLKPIRKGEEALLEDYGFKCRCNACLEEDPSKK
ncbi:histone-lysine N-methyltransferase ATXR [Salix suchowensis]|nr:histone-lysine N-methyltransferase ATXR [Salix suchowensis]